MLGFIKKYRNIQERTFLTVKCKRSFYILKRKDIHYCDKTENGAVDETNVNASCKTLHSSDTLGNCCLGYVLEDENAVFSGNK